MAKHYALVRRPVESRILFLRGRKVLLDSDLADLYRVTVKRLNEQVKRNAERFPDDFMFRLTPEETRLLRSQIATSNGGRGGRRYLPFVFTEHGAIMAASVLNSPQAVEMSVFVVRAFVRLNEILASNRELAAKVMELDRRLKTQDAAIHDIISAIKRLMKPPSRRIPQIGFRSGTL
ncbi:MAG: ORF6N domain-containing protein [Candidatus Korobacteraceae bacterium]